MWGRKDKEKRGERRKGGKGGAALPFMGLDVPPGPEAEEDLEAELLALQGKSPGKKASGKGSKVVSMRDIDSMVAGLDKVGESDEEEEEEGSDGEDDDDLMAELQEIANEEGGASEDEAPPTAPPTKPATVESSKPPAQSSQVTAVIAERLAMYERVIAEGKVKGESSKVRRYTRALDTIKTMKKKAESGKLVNIDDLPPPVDSSGGEGGGPKGATGVPQPEITDDELMSWANSGSSDPAPQAPKPKPRPVQQAPPPRPKPRPQAPPTTSGGGIDLDAPEFDLSEEDMAMLAAQMDSHKTPLKTEVKSGSPQPKPRQQTTPPRPKPRPQAPPTTSIDLDAPEFDEFNLSDEDMAMLAAQMDSHMTPQMDSHMTPQMDSHMTPQMDSHMTPQMDSHMTPQMDSHMTPQMDSHMTPQMVAGDHTKKRKLEMPQAPPPSQSLPATLSPRQQAPPTRKEVGAVLGERRDQFTAAMRQAKRQGNAAKARELGKMAATFSKVLKAFEQGQSVDLSQVPAPPPGYSSKFTFDLSKYKPPPAEPQPSQVATETPRGSVATETPQGSVATETPQEGGGQSDSGVPVPKTVLESLEQRLAKYEETKRGAEEKGETSRARRITRIVKQYQEAIKSTKAKKPYDYSELPDPPGYPPIPVPHSPRPVPAPQLQRPTQSLPPQGTVGSKFMPNPTVSHNQMEVLTQRKKELLTATKEAKGKGDQEKALHYLKLYKGVEQMVVVAGNGLPVDLSQLPPSPYAGLGKTTPSPAVLSHLQPAREGDGERFDRIRKQLQAQIDLCTSNAKLYQEIKNVGTATQYENMCQELQQQLLAIEGIQSQGLTPPKFTMETRKFSIVHSHTHISAGQCEVVVVKATAVPRPEGYEEKDLNVYVEIEFPWPGDDPPKICTESVRGTSCPEFNHTERFEVERKTVRSILRVLKRNPLKCTLWHKRTLRKHLFIGQGVLQLEKLETKCEVGGTVDLRDEKNRKPVGGKMEIVAKLREPFSGRDTEEKEEQWLTFQEPIAVTSSVQMPRPQPASSAPSQNLSLLSPAKVDTTTSVEALEIELRLVQNAIKSGHKDPATLTKGRQIQARMQVICQRLQSDPQFRGGYPRQVAKEMQQEQALEARLTQEGRNRQAKILQLRREAMQRELKIFSSKK